MDTRFLVVDLGAAHFGFDVLLASEVLPIKKASRVPWGPRWVMGVVNHQGRLITLVDLARFLELKPTPEPRTMVIVDRADLNLALCVGGIEVVEAKDAVRITEVKQFMPRASWVTESLSTSTLDFQHLDIRRVIDGIEEAF